MTVEAFAGQPPHGVSSSGLSQSPDLRPIAADPTGDTQPERARASVALRALVAAVFVLCTGAFVDVVEGIGPVGPLLWLGVHGLVAVLLADSVLRRRAVLPWPAAGAAVVALSLASVLWSDAPVVTVTDGIGLLGTFLFALLIAQRLAPVHLLDAVVAAMTVIALSSLVLLLAGDPRVLDPVHGTLRGVVVAKNSLGQAMSLGIVAAALATLLDPARWVRRAGIALLLAVVLVLSESATGQIIAVAGVGAVLVLRLRATHRMALPALTCLVVTAGLTAVLLGVAVDPRDAAEAVGRDATLTGRTEIWPAALEAVEAEPWLGYGYGAFWNHTGAAADIRSSLGFRVAHAHNGLLDVALQTGLLGVVAVVVALGSLLCRGLVDLRRGRSDVGLLRLSVLAITLVVNSVETGMFEEESLITVLLLVALAAPSTRARALPRPRWRRSTR